MSLKTAKKKLKELEPLLSEIFGEYVANGLLGEANRLVDHEIEKEANMAKYAGQTDDEIQVTLQEDREAAIKRMQEAAGEKLSGSQVNSEELTVNNELADANTEDVDTSTEDTEKITENVDTITEDVDTSTEDTEKITENVDTITEDVEIEVAQVKKPVKKAAAKPEEKVDETTEDV